MLILVCWLCCYPGMIYGVGAFIPVYMVDHGVTPHFVFLTFTVAYAATFVGFQFNSLLGEDVERRDTLLVLGIVFSLAWTVAYFYPVPHGHGGLRHHRPDLHDAVPVQPV